MKYLILFLLSTFTFGATYYVSVADGNDSDDGLTIANAWLTMAKVNGTSFSAGDNILFNKGDTWSGTRLTVPSSGTNGSPITFGAYGTGADPIIDMETSPPGWDTGTNWTGDGGAPTGNNFNEFFEATGYDETWTQGETIGSGATLDEDADPADVGSPPLWETKCLKSVITGTQNAYVEDRGIGAIPISYYRMDFVVTATGDGETNPIAKAQDGSAANVWKIVLARAGSNYKLQIYSYHDGSFNFFQALSFITLGSVVRVEVKWDATNNIWAWRVNGVDQPNDIDSSDPITSEGTLTSTHKVEVSRLLLGFTEKNQTATVYIDNVNFGTTDWLGAPGSTIWALPDNVTSMNTSPQRVRLDGTEYITAQNTGDLDIIYRWFWDTSDSTLYIFDIDTPSVSFSTLKIPSATHAIFGSDKSYITFNNLDVRGALYCIWWQASAANVNGFVMDSMTVGHNAARALYVLSNHNDFDVIGGEIMNSTFDTNYHLKDGDYFSWETSINGLNFQSGVVNWLIHDNIFTDWGHDAVIFSGAANRLTTGNELYDNIIQCPDSDGLPFATGSSSVGSATNNKIYRNTITGMAISANVGGTGNEIYYNLFSDMTPPSSFDYSDRSAGIQFIGLSSDSRLNKVYNNVFFGLPEMGIYYGDNVANMDSNEVVNNIFMNCGSNTFAGGAANDIAIKIHATADGGVFKNNLFFKTSVTDFINYRGAALTVAEFNDSTGQNSDVILNNITGDPLFTDAANVNFSLKLTSPAIDAGVNVSLVRDFINNRVPRGASPDIGAYEFWGLRVIMIGQIGNDFNWFKK